MEKRGVVSRECTPDTCSRPRGRPAKTVTVKNAAQLDDDHPIKRASEVVARKTSTKKATRR